MIDARQTAQRDITGGYLLAQRITGLRRSQLYRLVSERRIPHTRIAPRVVRFSASELREWLADRHVPAEPAR